MDARTCLLIVSLLTPGVGIVAQEAADTQAGVWEIRIHNTRNPGDTETASVVKICRDKKYDQFISALGKYKTGCVRQSTSEGADTMKIVSRCVVERTIVSSETTLTVQADSSHSETHTTFSPSWGGVTEEVSVEDQKLLGSCPANVKPGTVISATY